jgi:enamine deaminase RidA (YjgF/YER057c/UK114 family)
MVDKTLYISGQIGFDPSTMEIVQVTIVFRLYQQNGLITYYD